MFTVSTTNLNVVLGCNFLESGFVLTKIRQMDMDRSTQACTAVSRATGDVTQVAVVLELNFLLDGASASNKTLEHLEERRSLLHGNDTQVILFVDPHKEGLVVVVVNTTALGPVAIEIAGLEEAVTLLEQEVIVNELLLDISIHAVKRVIGSGKFTSHVAEALDDCLLKLVTVFSADAGAEAVVGSITSDANTSRLDHNLSSDGKGGAVHAISAHLAFMFVIGSMSVIILNNLVHEGSKSSITAMRTSIDADTGISVLGA